MELSSDMQIVLQRCKSMNCITEGQALSLGTFDSEFGGRNNVIAAMKAMVVANLIVNGPSGTYLLTRSGADVLLSPAFARKNNPQSKARQYGRPPVNKLQ